MSLKGRLYQIDIYTWKRSASTMDVRPGRIFCLTVPKDLFLGAENWDHNALGEDAAFRLVLGWAGLLAKLGKIAT